MSNYTTYDQYVITAFDLFNDLRIAKDVYATLFEKNLHHNSENVLKAAKDRSISAIANKCPRATPKQVQAMADVVIHLASQCKHVH